MYSPKKIRKRSRRDGSKTKNLAAHIIQTAGRKHIYKTRKRLSNRKTRAADIIQRTARKYLLKKRKGLSKTRGFYRNGIYIPMKKSSKLFDFYKSTYGAMPSPPNLPKPKIKKNGPGLLIHDTLVTSISGPAGITILKPTLEFHKSHKAPIFILFGDRHKSNEKMCDPCSCEEGQKSCCFEIYSTRLLKLIDEIAKDHIVHFSIEDGLNSYQNFATSNDTLKYHEKKAKAENFPMDKLRVPIWACYSKQYKRFFRDSYNELCPTQNILWHKADVRQSYLSGKPIEYQYDFYKCLHRVFMIIDNYVRKKNPERAVQETDLCSTECSYYFRNRDGIRLLQSFFEPDFHKRVAAFRRNGKIVSPIHKQIGKMSKEHQNDWEAYIDEYYKYYDTTYRRKNSYSEETKTFYKQIIYFVKHRNHSALSDLFQSDKMNTSILILDELLLYNSFTLDLYFLARSFKTTSDNTNPLISIGYFGRAHARNIKHFLLNIMKSYEVVFEVSLERGVVSRCLTIDKHVDLDALIEEYTQ